MPEVEDIFYGLVILFVIAIVCVYGFLIVSPLFTQQTIANITVVEKIPYHDGKYLIISKWEDKSWHMLDKRNDTPPHRTRDEVFTVGDEWILLKFDASDRYASLDEGKSYRVKVCGYRIHLLSEYRNIIDIQEV